MTPQSGGGGELPPHQQPEFHERELLVAEPHFELVQDLLGPGVTLVERGRTRGIVRAEVEVTPGERFDLASTIDGVRKICAEKFHGFEPVLSPVHIVTTGQPNVIGNPQDAMPRGASDRFPERAGSEGEGVTVAVIDSGIELHDWLNGGYVAMPADFERTVTVRDEDEDVLGQQAGHGVFLAGLILRQAPGATVKVLRVSDSDGRADVDAVAAAIGRAAAGGADIVNLSLGCFTRHNNPPWTLVQAIAELPNSTAVVASAGNSSTSRSFWPGALPAVSGSARSRRTTGAGRSPRTRTAARGSTRTSLRPTCSAPSSTTRALPAISTARAG